jgi:protein phosphatase
MHSSTARERPQDHVHSADVDLDVAALSDPGRVRPVNEDHYLVLRFSRAIEPLATNLPEGTLPDELSEQAHALMVADGMGGHRGGAEASRRAIADLIQQVVATPDWILRLEGSAADRVAQRSAERFRRASAAIREHAAKHPELAGMGTTLTVAVSFGLDLILTHVGDSRAYLWRDGRLDLLSRDHTIAQDFLDRGDGDVAHHYRHVLTHALGGRNPEPMTGAWRLRDGDRLLLCTDGLTDMVDDARIAALLAAHPGSQPACRALVDQALAAGGRDNVTVALAGYRLRGAA